VSHTQTPAQVATYRVEPYVVAADVYGLAPHVGHGGWTWYTGSAGWMQRVTLESVLGIVEEEGARYLVRPAIPDDWPGYTVALRRQDGTRYEFTVDNPASCAEAVVEATLDGEALAVAAHDLRVPVVKDGGVHHVRIVLGPHPSPGGA